MKFDMESSMLRKSKIFLALAIGFFSVQSFAENNVSGFLSDYEQLQPAEDISISYIYTTPDFRKKIANTTAFIIEQPEIFIAPDSKYGGMKPDDMKTMADSMRAIVAETLVKEYQIAASPGPNTLLMRMAFTNVHLKKKGRNLLGYTPIGFVAGGVKRNLLNDFVDNILLTEVVWEAEILDSQTGERYGAIITKLGDHDTKKEFTSWDQLIETIDIGAQRIVCRLENANAAEGEIRDCVVEITAM
jgi:hypothetical protein